MTSIVNLLSKVEPLQELNLAEVEQQVAASRPKPSARDKELSDEMELAQLEAAYNSLFGANGESWEDIATKRRARIVELSEAIKQVKDGLTGRTHEGPVRRKLAKAEVELEGLVRKLANAEALAEGNRKARAAFESDGRMARLKELRKARAAQVRDPLSVL